MNDQAKLIQIFQMMLAQLEAIVGMMPELMSEDGRSESLGNQIASYQSKVARLKNVLRQQKDHEERKREIDRSNKLNRRKT